VHEAGRLLTGRGDKCTAAHGLVSPAPDGECVPTASDDVGARHHVVLRAN
jgi:hypothetical protein